MGSWIQYRAESRFVVLAILCGLIAAGYVLSTIFGLKERYLAWLKENPFTVEWRGSGWRVAIIFGLIALGYALKGNYFAVIAPLGFAVFAFPPLWHAIERRGIGVPVWTRWLGAAGVLCGVLLAGSMGLGARQAPSTPPLSVEAQATDDFLGDVARVLRNCNDSAAIGQSGRDLTNPLLNMWAAGESDICDQAAHDLKAFELPTFLVGPRRTEAAKALADLANAYSAKAQVFDELAKATTATANPGEVSAALERARAVPVSARLADLTAVMRAASAEASGPKV